MAELRLLAAHRLRPFAGVLAAAGSVLAGSAPASYRWTDVSSAMWTEIETEGAAQGDTAASTYRARVAGIPTSGTATLSSGGDLTAAVNALASNGVLVLNAGTYAPTAMTTLSGSKKVVAAPGATVVIDCSGVTDGNPVINITGTNNIFSGGATGVIVMVNLRNIGVQQWGGATNGLVHHVSIAGGIIQSTGAGICTFYDAVNCLVCSCEVLQLTDSVAGGNSDGFNFANNTGAGTRNAAVDCHAYQNSDDGFDTWQSNSAQYFYFCTAVRQGKHPIGPNGDGNGFKLGTGSGQHNLYKCSTNDNLEYGYNYNGNSNSNAGGSSWPRLNQCTSTGDDLGPYQGGTAYYNIVAAVAPQPTDVQVGFRYASSYAVGGTVYLEYGLLSGDESTYWSNTPTSYTVTIQLNGSTVSGGGTNVTSFTPAAAGELTYSVVASNAGGSSSTVYSASITVV